MAGFTIKQSTESPKWYEFFKKDKDMSAQSILLVLRLVSEGIGVAKEIADLARRVQAGEEITEAEIEAARKKVAESVAKWDAETQK